MKRYRAVDVPPKFRRTAKGRNTRIGYSVYFSRFFSAYNLVYLKFFLMWVCCITLDFLIGFRFELLWPVWLLVRHLYESFRVHAFSSSLHYSAFSVFFVCVTATSDLVCYLFIPIQVLIFLASTYVWVQFVYQSSDRGVCLPSLFLWALFIVFEYSVRYRFDNATWYLTRTSWITAGLFPSTADSVSIGLSANSSSSSSPSSTRLELYRPFAAHCIGFPVVTLGFRVKSFFSNWRMRVRREEVMRQNEFFERLLADVIPTSFENRKHFISSRSHFSMDQDVLGTLMSRPWSGEGSNVPDEEEWEHESVHYQSVCTADHHGSKKKWRRTRVASSISHSSTAPTESTNCTSSSALLNASSHKTASTTSTNASSFAIPSISVHHHNNSSSKLSHVDLIDIAHSANGGLLLQQQQQHETVDNNFSECSLVRENAQRLSELRQLQKEKQTLELSFDKIKFELKTARSSENELRVQLSNAQRLEHSCRDEWKQFERDQKQRMEQLEIKSKQLVKQNEYFKMNTQALERRVGELQLKKSEIERELTNERLRNSRDDPIGKQQQQQNATDSVELKQKLANQDKELKSLRKEAKLKSDQCTKLEDELRLLRTAKSDRSKQMETMRQKNSLLEQTLSSENKLKQDLFLALNDSKAEIAALKARLHSKQTKEHDGMMNAFRNHTNGGGVTVGLNSSGSSPTVQQQQQRQFQFPISQQKSLTPPPLSVGSSTFNSTLEQLLQATQNMSYSLSPLDTNGALNGSECGNYNASGMTLHNSNSTSSGSSPFVGVAASEMLAVGGHRSTSSSANITGPKDGASSGGGSLIFKN